VGTLRTPLLMPSGKTPTRGELAGHFQVQIFFIGNAHVAREVERALHALTCHLPWRQMLHRKNGGARLSEDLARELHIIFLTHNLTGLGEFILQESPW